jgi:ParB family chromosome partitioning protein
MDRSCYAFPYGHARNLRRLHGTPSKLTADEAAAIEALQMERAALEAQYENVHDTPEDVCARLDEIEARLGAFESRPLNYDPAQIRRAGALVTIDADGELSIDRGASARIWIAVPHTGKQSSAQRREGKERDVIMQGSGP